MGLGARPAGPSVHRRRDLVVRDTLRGVLGIMLVVVGTVHIFTAISSKAFNDAWWFGVIGGTLEVFIGFWVSAQSFRAQGFFLILWAGLLALFRGIFEIVLAFEMRSAQSQLERADPSRAPATANRSANANQ
jgi:uncharacterized membrane protein HdeD (DUF308 family)